MTTTKQTSRRFADLHRVVHIHFDTDDDQRPDRVTSG
ncbi:MAG: hypothetical protein QOF25_1198 [Mycobacterium sp.]|jgi:hypothetical protein|nr:hypothetical protein [Mycobacterium sp.]